jgi:hypothetical protein
VSARTIWDELRQRRWQVLEEWKRAGEPESLHLDFKESDQASGVPGPRDRKNLSKGLSAFGNVEGGVLVFGASTSGGKPDVLSALKPVQRLDEYAERLRAMIANSTTPTIPGVQVEAIEEPPLSRDVGVVAVFVPINDGGPYRASGDCGSDVKDRYYIRSTTDSTPMAHQTLAAMFGRRAGPRLRVALRRDNVRRIALVILNQGAGYARLPYVRFQFTTPFPSNENVGLDVLAPWERRYPRVRETEGSWLAVSLPSDHVIYPQEPQQAANIEYSMNKFQVRGRIDAEGSEPVRIDRTVELVQGTDVLLHDDEQ